MARAGTSLSMTQTALIVAVVGLLAATVGVAAGRDDGASTENADATDDRSTSSSTAPSTTEPDVSLDDLTGAARDLAELLAEGRAGTYHATYVGAASSGDGSTLSLETWAKDGRFRQDTVVDVGGEAFHRANFVLPDQGAACTRLGEAAWSCEPVPLAEVEGANLLSGTTLDQLRQAAVGESAGEVDGRPARCFTITYDAQTTELCASGAGVPLRIRSQSSQLTIEQLEDEVDDEAFELPAELA